MLTPYKWHVTYDTQYEKDESFNQWVNYKGAYKTAMAKTRILKSICCAIFMKVLRIFCDQWLDLIQRIGEVNKRGEGRG